MLPLKKTKSIDIRQVQQESAYGLAAWESLQYWHVSLQIFLLELMMPEKFAQ